MPAVVLFDGVCNLCNRSVDFILQRDAKAYFRFASLQSDAARRLLAEHGRAEASPHAPESIVLIEDGRVYERSTAVLRIARHLRGWARLALIAFAFPRPLRDAVYRWIARHRYRWFGQRESCRVATPELATRFLS
jgi:predicted DCC family thiol-disulfide oxidoreductase YuxK